MSWRLVLLSGDLLSASNNLRRRIGWPAPCFWIASASARDSLNESAGKLRAIRDLFECPFALSCAASATLVLSPASLPCFAMRLCPRPDRLHHHEPCRSSLYTAGPTSKQTSSVDAVSANSPEARNGGVSEGFFGCHYLPAQQHPW